ncbi:MAG: TonB-dependent receptor [Gammaproteobacteria bacterium]|nr:TonB-dependent receptor [Gammaproteobacteria bacterium]
MKTKLSTALLAVAATAGFFATAPSLAQDGASTALEEIIVSARKRDESLQDVPVAVSAFGIEEIANRGIRSIEDVAKFSPGLSFAKAFGRATDRPVIRGQGNVLAGVQFGVESGAAYFVDGTYYPGDLSSLDLANVERVEVIRGPQAALYGRNTYSGAINFITKGVGDEVGGDAKVRFGENGEQDIYATIRGPMGDTFAGSLTGRFYSYDGEYTNVVTGQTVGDEETTSISGRLDFMPSENVTFSLNTTYQEDRDGTRAFFLQPSEMNNCQPGTRSNASWLWTGSSNNNQYYCGEITRPGDTVALNDGPAITTVTVPGIPDSPLPGFDIPGVFPPGLFPGGDPYSENDGLAFSGVDRDISITSLKMDMEMSNGWAFVASTTFRDEDRKTGSDSDHSSVNFLGQSFNPNPAPGTVECTFCASGRDEYSDYSIEARLQSPVDNATRWLVGAFYYEQEHEISDITFAGIDPVERKETVDNFAIFASVEHDFSDALSASLELRFFEETKGRNEFDIMESFENTFDEIAPRFTFNYALSDDSMLYGVYAKGYKPGGVIGSDGANLVPQSTTYEQEESDNFELGLKNTLLDGRMVANVAVFFIDAENIQLTTPLADGGSGSLTSVVTNQGSGETFGVELEARFALNDSTTIGATYALADSEFTQGCDDFQWTMTSGGGILDDAVACSGSDPQGSGNGSIVGNQFPLSSKNQFSAYLDYTRGIGGDREFFANLSYSFEDKKAVQVHNLAWVPEASIVDLQVGIAGQNWSAKVYGRNLTDEDAPSMVTRWLQDPLLSIYASGLFGGQVDTTNAGAPAGFCAAEACSTNFPRAFFGDMRQGRHIGVEFNYRFGN